MLYRSHFFLIHGVIQKERLLNGQWKVNSSCLMMTFLFTIERRKETKMPKFEPTYFSNYLIPILSTSDRFFKICSAWFIFNDNMYKLSCGLVFAKIIKIQNFFHEKPFHQGRLPRYKFISNYAKQGCFTHVTSRYAPKNFFWCI